MCHSECDVLLVNKKALSRVLMALSVDMVIWRRWQMNEHGALVQ